MSRAARLVLALVSLLTLGTTPSAATAPERQVVDLTVTIDWGQDPRAVLAPVARAWAIDRSAIDEDERHEISISVTPGPQSHVVVEAKSHGGDPTASFEFSFSEAPVSETTYRVHVDVVDRVDPWPGDQPANPTFRDAYNTDDISALWDGGHPLIGERGRPPRAEYVEILTDPFVHARYADVFYRVPKLNDTMATYFELKVPYPVGDRTSAENYVVLRKRDGAPPLPAAYWTQPWFTFDYTVFGTIDDGASAPREFSEEHRVTFGEPRWDYAVRIAPTHYYAKAGATSWFTPVHNGEGVTSGSVRLHVLDLPKSLTKHFEVLVHNPTAARRDSEPRIAVRPRTAKAAALGRTLRVPFVASVVLRNGETVYTAPKTLVFRPST